MHSSPGVVVDVPHLQEVHRLATAVSDGWTVEVLLDCAALLRRVLHNYAHLYDRPQLAQVPNFQTDESKCAV